MKRLGKMELERLGVVDIPPNAADLKLSALAVLGLALFVLAMLGSVAQNADEPEHWKVVPVDASGADSTDSTDNALCATDSECEERELALRWLLVEDARASVESCDSR